MWPSTPITSLWCVAILLGIASEFLVNSSYYGTSERYDDTLGLAGGCNSLIYCRGKMLNTLQQAEIFPDSKTLVDMPLKYSPSVVLESFMNLPDYGYDTLVQFVNNNFAEVGSDIVDVVHPVDWHPSPAFLNGINDPPLRAFGYFVHTVWKNLTKQFDHSKYCSECYSSILVPNPFVVAGDRFREYYYWDTYWIMKGLLVSGMTNTTRGMIDNALLLVKTYGFVPNGGRIYYLNRSQPPLLTQMVLDYIDNTGDFVYLADILPILDLEYSFWMNNRSQTLGNFTVNHYDVDNELPRPEAYMADFNMTKLMNDTEKRNFFRNIASAAESGEDFSSEWFESTFDFSTINTRRVTSVALNSMMFANELTLSAMHVLVGDHTKANEYYAAAQARWNAMQHLFWNQEKLQWYDYHMDWERNIENYYATNWMPLWTISYSNLHELADLKSDLDFKKFQIEQDLLDKILDNIMTKEEAFNYPAGIPTSLFNTTQQWDFPNVWAPLMYFLINGIENVNNSQSATFAQNLAQRWITTNYCGWKESGFLYEKYDAQKIGKTGGGGEYSPQSGFGWTNGMALHILQKYGEQLKAPTYCPNLK